MFCAKCGSDASPSDSKFCIVCGSSINANASVKAPVGSNICWNCGEGKQQIYGNCSKCGMNLAGEQSISSVSQSSNNWKLVAIPVAIAIVALVVWGFSRGVSQDQNYVDQQSDSTQSNQDTSIQTDAATDSPTVATIYEYLEQNGTADWLIDQFNDLTSGSEGVILSDQCAIWVYPDVETKTAAIDSGTFENLGEQYFWWDDDPSWSGVVLVADDEFSNCATDAEDALGWNLEDFTS